MMLIQCWIWLGMVGALVGAPALGAGERAAGDEAGEGVRIVEQAAKTLGAADDAGVAPQRSARDGVPGDGEGSVAKRFELRRLRRAAPGSGLGEGVQNGAAGEDEALAERVGGEPVGAVQAGAGGLADRVQPGQASSARSRSATIPPIM